MGTGEAGSSCNGQARRAMTRETGNGRGEEERAGRTASAGRSVSTEDAVQMGPPDREGSPAGPLAQPCTLPALSTGRPVGSEHNGCFQSLLNERMRQEEDSRNIPQPRHLYLEESGRGKAGSGRNRWAGLKAKRGRRQDTDLWTSLRMLV